MQIKDVKANINYVLTRKGIKRLEKYLREYTQNKLATTEI